MAENCGSSEYTVNASAPSALSQTELADCVTLIASGGAVDPSSAKRELPYATSVATARKSDTVVGVGAIKRIRRGYASSISKHSGVNFPSDTPELGYVRIHDDHQRKGLSRRIVTALLSGYGGAVFATTSSAAMKKTLREAEFCMEGCEWEGKSGAQLSLWLRGVDAKYKQ
jgi:hypothetical protein